MKTSLKIITLLMLFVIILGTVGVQATWTYISADPKNETLTIDFRIPEPVQWDDKEILPPEHARLIEIFVREINDPDSVIHQHTKDRLTGILDLNWFGQKDTLGSMDDDGDALRELFSCEYSSFIIKMKAEKKWVSGPIWNKVYEITYTSFDVYTTETDFSKFKSGDWVNDVYKTTFTKNTNGEWEAVESFNGRAPFAYYDVEWSSQRIPSFNVDKWEAVKT